MQGIDTEKVTRWLIDRIPALVPPVEFSLIAGGHSNLTYRCRDARGGTWVLRRPPLGHVLESAHDMGREHRIVSALADTPVPVPKTWGLCLESDVNGAPFYVMSFVDGAVLHDVGAAEGVPESRRKDLGEHVVDVLVELHHLDPDAVGLGDLGRKEAYLARQLRRWSRQWDASKTHEIPAMEATARLLEERMPEQIGACIVHGDFRLGNMIVGGGRVRALLDWELCTLGDPLADVGYLLNSWAESGETGVDLRAPSSAVGFPPRKALVERYQRATGRDLAHIDYYRAFSHWRLAAIGQGVYKRYRAGAMGEDRDFDLDAYRRGVEERAKVALALIGG